MEKNQLRWVYRLLVIVLFFVALLLFLKLKPYWLPILKIIKVVTIPFFISLIISFLLFPLVHYIEKIKIPRWLSILLLYVIFVGVVGYLVYKGIPVVIAQLQELNSYLPQFLTNYQEIVIELNNEASDWPLNMQGKIQEIIFKVEMGVNQLILNSTSLLEKIANSVVILFVIPIIVFYFLKDREKLKEMFYSIVPWRYRDETKSFFTDLSKTLGGYIRGQLIVGVVIGVSATLLLWLFGMKYAVLLGIVIGITNIIPYFGPILGAIPALVIALTVSFKMVIIVAVIIFGLQFLEGNILSPYIIGKNISIHPVWIIFALMAGGELGGLGGMIIAVPILVILKVLFIHVRKHFSTIR